MIGKLALCPSVRIWGIVLLSACAGCIHLEQEIHITGENSGTFKIHFAIPKDLHKTLIHSDTFSHSNKLAHYFIPKLGSKLYTEVNGLKLSQYRVYERGDNLNVLIEGEILDLRRASNSKLLGEFSLIEGERGTRLQMNFNTLKDWQNSLVMKPSLEKENRNQQLKNLVVGMTLSLKIYVPNEMINTSAPIKDKNLAQWVFDPQKDDQFLSAPPNVHVEYR